MRKKNIGRDGIWTRGRWRRSAKDTSVLYSSPQASVNLTHGGQQLFKKEKKIKNASSSKIYAQANKVDRSAALKKKMDIIK